MNGDGDLSTDCAARVRQIVDACLRRRAAGEVLPDQDVIAAHAKLMPELGEALRAAALVGAAVERARAASDETVVASAGVESQGSKAPDAAGGGSAGPVLNAESIPGYQILKEIHRGGQGVVYQAVQISTHRKVAIKVMKEGPFAGASDRARFEREVQILGQLQHPNIVGVHDSGSAAGNFYFVMDYIPGQPLDVYMAGAAEHRRPAGEEGGRGSRRADGGRPGLSIESTLTLFAKICEAVNAAHLRGVIHRDLKPGNIRVDPSGEPHILDFGLAKVSAFDPIGDGGASLMTMTGQFVGSLPWASPEQAEGQPSKIDVRTDVYSLGVILYQMLTGRFPYEVVGNMRDVLDRILRAEPAKPSTIRKQINDEVETIVLKCLSKERERRYQTGGELARDVGHYLAGEPIEAKRDSAFYVLGKYLQRYRLPAAVIAAIVLLILGFSLVMTLQAEHNRRLAVSESKARADALLAKSAADEARDRAQASEAAAKTNEEKARAEAAKAENVTRFLQDMLASADPANEGAQVKVVDILAGAATRLETEFADQPEVELALRQTIGHTYDQLDRRQDAEPHFVRAVELARRVYGPDDERVGAALDDLRNSYCDLMQIDKALAAAREELELLRRKYGDDDRRVAEMRGFLRRASAMSGTSQPGEPPVDLQREAAAGKGRALEAVRRANETVRSTWEKNRRELRDQDPQTIDAMVSVALCLDDRADQEKLLREVIAADRVARPVDAPERLRNLGRFAQFLGTSDRNAEEAEQILREVLELSRRSERQDKHATVVHLTCLADIFERRGKLSEAAAALRDALAMAGKVMGEEHSWTLGLALKLASLLEKLDNLSEAEELLHDCVRISRKNFGPAGAATMKGVTNLSDFLTRHGRYVELEALLRESLADSSSVPYVGDVLAVGTHVQLGGCLMKLDRYEEAESELKLAYVRLRELAQSGSPVMPTHVFRQRQYEAASGLVELYRAWGKPELAAEWQKKLDDLPAPPPAGRGDAAEPNAAPTSAQAQPQPAMREVTYESLCQRFGREHVVRVRFFDAECAEVQPLVHKRIDALATKEMASRLGTIDGVCELLFAPAQNVEDFVRTLDLGKVTESDAASRTVSIRVDRTKLDGSP